MMTQNEMICIGCQECCKWITFTINYYNQKEHDDLVEFYTFRGIKVVEYADSIAVMIETTCPHLTQYGCNCYGLRPELCRKYDGRNDPLMMDVCKLPKEK